MAGSGVLSGKALWQYSHSASVLFAVLLFLSGFLCTLLWTNNIVVTSSGAAPISTSTWTYYSPAVSTFSITYNVALFGVAWNTIVFVALLVLERDALPISTDRLRYEIEKAACVVAVAGNTIYTVACLALTSVLADLASNAVNSEAAGQDAAAQAVADAAQDRRAGLGVTAAMAGLAAASALWACGMDIVHALNSSHRRAVKGTTFRAEEEEIKQA